MGQGDEGGERGILRALLNGGAIADPALRHGLCHKEKEHF